MADRTISHARFFEPLERRRLLSSTPALPPSPVTAQISTTGTLVVTATPAADRLVLRKLGGSYEVTCAGYAALLVGGSGVKRVRLLAGGGGDRVAVDPSVTVRCTLLGEGGNDVLSGNAGDQLYGGAGNDKLLTRCVRPTKIGGNLLAYPPNPNGPSLLSGGAGNDTLVAGGTDTVVGGSGQDLAVYHRYVPTGQPLTTAAPDALARKLFDYRASGIEHFSVLTEDLAGHTGMSG